MIEKSLRYSCFAYRVSAVFRPFVYDQETIDAAIAEMTEGSEAPDSDADESEIDRETEDTKERGSVVIDVGYRIPTDRYDRTPEGGEVATVDGGELTGRFILTDPSKPYVALTIPLELKLEDSIAYATRPATDTLASSTTVSAGVGVEGGVPLGEYATLYVGAGVSGGVEVSDYLHVDPDAEVVVETGSETRFVPSAYATGGLRVSPVSFWHVYAGVKPTTTFTGGQGLSVPVYVGSGVTF